MKKASDLFIECLENEGVEYIFAVPGEENLAILESLRKSKIKLILTRHEQGAGFMASTYGRLTGKAGVCMATLGPGATNLLTPAAYAQLGAMPLIMITGQKPIKKSKQGKFQIIDIVETMKPLTKMTHQIVHGNTIPAIIRESFRLAVEERPGAVHLELPEDIAEEETDAIPFTPNRRIYAQAAEKVIQHAAEMLSSAKRPLILIGAGANRKRISKSTEKLIQQTGIPFFNTQMGKGVIDERHELFIGTAALSSNDYIHCSIDRADLVVNIGHDVIEKPPFFMEHGGKKVIHINFFAAVVDEIYFPQVEVIGDIAHSVSRLADLVTINKDWNTTYPKRVKKHFLQHFQEQANKNIGKTLITPQWLVSVMRKVMPDDGILTLDNGVYKIWFARNYPSYQANTLLLDNALATMGAGLPSGMAAKLIMPQRKVISVCGDGGFMMNSQEIETAVRLGLDMVVAVLRDNAYGMIKWKQAGMGLPKFGLDYGNPDFVKYAEAYGAKGSRVNSANELESVLSRCLLEPGVHIVEIPVDYSENERVLIEELKNKTCLI